MKIRKRIYKVRSTQLSRGTKVEPKTPSIDERCVDKLQLIHECTRAEAWEHWRYRREVAIKVQELKSA